MIRFLSTKDCNDIHQYLGSASPDEQYWSEIFNDQLRLRQYIFNARIISLGEYVDEKLCKLFSIIVPERDTFVDYCTILAMFNDASFIIESIRLLADLFDPGEYKKLKVIFYEDRFQTYEETLFKCGFVKEVDLKGKMMMKQFSHYFDINDLT